MIFIIGITLAFFLEFLLLSKRTKVKADIILAFWMFFIGLHLFLFYLQYEDLYARYPAAIGLIFPLPLVHGPFLFLYVSALTNQQPRKRGLQFIHFVPAFLMYVYLIQFFIRPPAEKIEVMRSGGAEYHVFNTVSRMLIFISGIVYVVLSQIFLRRYRRSIREQFSSIQKINLNWLQYLVVGMGFIWVVILFVGLFFARYFHANEIHSDKYIFTAVVLFVFFLGFFGLKQTHIFVTHSIQLPRPEADQAKPSEKSDPGKYAKSGLKDTDAELLHQRLNEYMKAERPYLNSDLSLSKLSESFGVHPNSLSQVINEREHKNFYDYVNEYRIEEFKRLASDPKGRRYTILTLAFECGFNSKSAFNNFFKKSTGQTPSEYMKEGK